MVLRPSCCVKMMGFDEKYYESAFQPHERLLGLVCRQTFKFIQSRGLDEGEADGHWGRKLRVSSCIGLSLAANDHQSQLSQMRSISHVFAVSNQRGTILQIQPSLRCIAPKSSLRGLSSWPSTKVTFFA